jgi:DNA-binding transcriptional LysR family regulator
MDLKRLKYFCKVVEQGSVSRAARVLNMAQPPLSKRIRELEEELNVPLFMRDGNSMTLTKAGESFYRRACQILRQVEIAARETSIIANHEGRILRVGLTHLYQNYFTPLLLEFYQRNPEVKISVSVTDSSSLESLLNDGIIDIALIQKPSNNDGYEYISFDPIKLVAVVNRKLLPDVIPAPFPWLRLADFPLVLLHRARDVGIYERLLDHFRSSGASPNVIMSITQPGIILNWLENGLEAATLLPASEVDADRLRNCCVLDIFPAPQVFYPALVKSPATPYNAELLDIIAEGYPGKQAKVS